MDLNSISQTEHAINQQKIAEVQGHADALTATWKNAPDVVVVSDMQDEAVPEAVRKHDAEQRSQGATGDPENFFYKGKVYVLPAKWKTPKIWLAL